MPCAPCQRSRQQFVQAARSLDVRQMGQAIGTAYCINADKVRGVSSEEINRRYGGGASKRYGGMAPMAKWRKGIWLSKWKNANGRESNEMGLTVE